MHTSQIRENTKIPTSQTNQHTHIQSLGHLDNWDGGLKIFCATLPTHPSAPNPHTRIPTDKDIRATTCPGSANCLISNIEADLGFRKVVQKHSPLQQQKCWLVQYSTRTLLSDHCGHVSITVMYITHTSPQNHKSLQRLQVLQLKKP